MIMSKANSVLSTPPTNTPIDTTRRRFLAVAVGASVASVGTLAAAAMPIAAPYSAACAVDPIYAAIEAHRKAYATMQAIFAEHRRAHSLADAEVGPAHIDIPSMVDPGSTIEASHWTDIERAIPRLQYPDLYSHQKGLLDERTEAHAALVESLIGGDEDELTDEPCHDELDTRDAFSETVPTTVPGLLAMIAYACEITKRDPEAFADSNCSLIETLGAAAKAIAQVRA
jgi:hypothetical protein